MFSHKKSRASFQLAPLACKANPGEGTRFTSSVLELLVGILCGGLPGQQLLHRHPNLNRVAVRFDQKGCPLPEPGARFFWKVLPSHQLTWNLTFGGSGFGPFSFQRTSGSMCIGGSGQEVSKTKGLILLEFWNNSQIASGWVCQWDMDHAKWLFGVLLASI